MANEDLEVGQLWRLSSGELVRIAEVSGNDVNGTVQVGATTSSGRNVHAGTAGWAGNKASFDGAELVGPLFRVSFLFPPAAPNDPIFDALSSVGSVDRRGSGRIETGSGEKGENLDLGLVEWVADVVASDGDAAKARIEEALVSHGSVIREEMQAKQLPVV